MWASVNAHNDIDLYADRSGLFKQPPTFQAAFPRTMKRLGITEATIAKRLRTRLRAADLGDAASYHSTILAESWITMSTIAECIEVFSRERDFITAMQREPVDFFTELDSELALLKSRTRELEVTLKALLAAFYRQKRKGK